jgi:hypothetical protein
MVNKEQVNKEQVNECIGYGRGRLHWFLVLALTDAVEDVAVIENLTTGRKDVLPDTLAFVLDDIGDWEA